MKLKWDITGKGDEPWGEGITQYEGEVPPKGSYVVRIKRMTVSAIKAQGVNHGKPRIAILLEVVGGSSSQGVRDTNYPYYGAPIWDGLNIIKDPTATGKINAFLHALTDGSDEAKRAVETAFWPPNGPDAKKEARRDGTEELHIKKIGKYPIESPAGEFLVRIISKIEPDLQQQPRAAVNQYLPYKGPQPEKAAANGQVDDTAGMEIVDDDAGADSDIIDAVEVISAPDDVVELDAVEEPPF